MVLTSMRGAIAVAGFLAAALCAGDLGCARSAGDAAFNGDEIYGACAAPLDDGNPCVRHECSNGRAKDVPLPSGTAIPDSTPGDCMAPVCGDDGVMLLIAREDDAPAAASACDRPSCSGSTVVHTPAAAGVQCALPNSATGVCDGVGSCVECMGDADCGAGGYCAGRVCSRCDDGVQNGDETGVDCGGLHCKRCDGAQCQGTGDCKSGNCADGVCCDVLCDGVCQACNLPGSEGTCGYIPLDGEDATCGMNMACLSADHRACTGFGTCLGLKGAACKQGLDCFSHHCDVGVGTCT